MLSFFLLNTALPPAPPPVPDAAAVADAQPAGRTLAQALGPLRSLLWFAALPCAILLVGSGFMLFSAAVDQDAAAEDADARPQAWLSTAFGFALAVLGLGLLTSVVWPLLSHPIW